jgi:broad specificity phosphatase PhoE
VPLAPLTRYGRAQATTLAAGQRSTGSTRAGGTARQTAELLGAPVTVLPELAEIGIGAREGEVDAGLRRETAEVLRAWVVAGDLDRRVADGETGHAVLARMAAAFERIAAAGGTPLWSGTSAP